MSVDVPAKAAETAAEKNITFPLVTNPQADVLEAYNLAYQVPEELVTKYRDEYGIDLEGASGETHHKIAVPATFIIDQSGAIRFSHVDEDYRSRISAEDVLKQLP
jgi:peroxiredoxin